MKRIFQQTTMTSVAGQSIWISTIDSLFHSNVAKVKSEKKNQFQSVKCWKADSTTLHFFLEHSLACESSTAKDIHSNGDSAGLCLLSQKWKPPQYSSRSRGGVWAPLILQPNWGPKGWKKFFWDQTPPPLISGSRWLEPPLSEGLDSPL